MMRILFITTSPLRKDNTVGNTFANIFEGLENVEFSSVYCKSILPTVEFVKRFFCITEKDIIRNLKNKNTVVGKEAKVETDKIKEVREDKFSFMVRMLRFKVFFWARDLVWQVGNWKSDSLRKFIEEVNPDIIFAPLDNNRSLNRFIDYVHSIANCKLAVYAWDDIYTLNQFSFSPFFWIDRFYQRPAIKRVAEKSDLLYVISEMQKESYEKCFGRECKVLTKGHTFEEKPEKIKNTPIKIIYTGNLGYQRWKSILALKQELEKINETEIRAQLFVYSKTALRTGVIKKIDDKKSVFFMGGVSHGEAMKIQKDADVLLHIESFGKKQRKLVKLSFSTKLVDYFATAKCIFAIGPKEVASIDHLVKNDAAVVATSKKEIGNLLRALIQDDGMIAQYGDKAWDCGKRNHGIKEIQNQLYQDFEEAYHESRSN